MTPLRGTAKDAAAMMETFDRLNYVVHKLDNTNDNQNDHHLSDLLISISIYVTDEKGSFGKSIRLTITPILSSVCTT